MNIVGWVDGIFVQGTEKGRSAATRGGMTEAAFPWETGLQNVPVLKKKKKKKKTTLGADARETRAKKHFNTFSKKEEAFSSMGITLESCSGWGECWGCLSKWYGVLHSWGVGVVFPIESLYTRSSNNFHLEAILCPSSTAHRTCASYTWCGMCSFSHQSVFLCTQNVDYVTMHFFCCSFPHVRIFRQNWFNLNTYYRNPGKMKCNARWRFTLIASFEVDRPCK